MTDTVTADVEETISAVRHPQSCLPPDSRHPPRIPRPNLQSAYNNCGDDAFPSLRIEASLCQEVVSGGFGARPVGPLPVAWERS